MSDKYTYHELSKFFPMLPEDEFEKLKDSISRIGQREPIVLYEGQILDGRNRFEACMALGIEPRFVKLNSGTDPMDYVVAANLRRRHLAKSQAIAILRRVYPPQPVGNQPKSLVTKPLVSQESLAKKAGVSEATVKDVDRVIAKAPDLQNKIADGEMTITEAKREVTRREERGTWKSGKHAVKAIDLLGGAERWWSSFENHLFSDEKQIHHEAAQYLNNRIGKLQKRIDGASKRLKEYENV